MVEEKESRAKEGMKIMGLSEGTYFLSYFLQYLVINIVVSLINAIIAKFIFTKIPFYFLYLIIFLWAMDVFALAFFFQSFIDSTRYALILSLLLYFVMYFLSMACIKETAAKSIKIGLSFFPPVALEVGIVMIGRFECHFRKFHPKYFTNIYTNYSLFIMYLMFIIDFFIYLFLGYYLQNVLPHTYGIRKPFYFLFTSDYWCGKSSGKKNIKKTNNTNNNNDNLQDFDTSFKHLDSLNKKKSSNSNDDSIFTDYYKNDPNFEGEALYKDRTKIDDALRIKNIVKTFEDGKTAVNHVNLNFYKDEIFALLGHNGAGKTTLISMLTGLYEATEGNAYYDGDDILIGNNMDKFRLKLGICPQHDVLFEDLTIREHLEMFSIFKGVSSDDITNEVNKSLNDFQLNEIQDIVIEDLSAGQKRQLSVAIALIGGSKVIFLDEPSSGMDITSRRNLWEILKRQSDQKIIILTTHYMEEASVLGKRIGIINEGRMKCIGTPLFLIERFGKYMSITISKEEDAINEDIINYIYSRTKDTQCEVLSEEILFRIPKSNYTEGGNLNLNDFFNDFDNNLYNLKIKSYSVSMPTLEDVFLNVASEDSKQLLKERRTFSNNELNDDNDKILFETDFKEDYSNKSKFCNDFYASFKRRLFLILRDLKSFLMEVLCPILLVIIGLAVSKVKFKWVSDPWHMDISYIGQQNVLFSSINTIENITDYHFYDSYVNVTCQTLKIGNFSRDQKQEAIVNFIEKIYETNKDTEDSKLKEVDMTNEDYTGYFGGLLMLEEADHQYEFVEAINARVAHGVPIYTFYFLKQIIQKAAGRKITIDFVHYPFPLTNEFKQRSDQANNSIVVLFVATAFSLIPASFVTILVRERINNSKHLMRVSGIDIKAYWIVNYLFELIKYYVTCGICVLFIWIFDFYRKYLTLLYILYGPAMISCTYILSFCFDKESSAQNGIILLNFLIGALGATIVLMFRGLEDMVTVGKILEYIFAFLPSFCFDFGYDFLLNKIIIYVIDYEFTWMFLTNKDLIKRFNLLLSMIIYLVLEIIIYTILVFIIEKCSYSYKKPSDERIETNINDSLVLKEIEKANINDIEVIDEYGNPNKNEYSVRLKNLRKVFKRGGCCSKEDDIVAIKNLNFCVEQGECFGLLGLNGAGKTTTFKCITQEISPTNGSIYINGKDTSNNFNQFKSLIGYCPQYEAIFEYMTVYENLEFYARIKGVKHELLDKLVKAMIIGMSLEDYTEKVAGKLSGGNKRKLSVAVSLLCTPQIILLDEPSTGMDPEARRFMWSIIHKTSKKGNKSSVIMTTHSMDEAETLCKRMGIMVNGEFVCLGKANQIKEKYGYGYEIDMRIKPMNINQQNEFISLLNAGNYGESTYNKKTKVNNDNINDILIKINKNKFCDELKEDRLGKKIIRDIKINGNIALMTLLNWVFFVQNAFKFIKNAQNYFEEIILSEHIENNFLFKLKKGQNVKSIGFFFGLFEQHKDECYVTEYSIQPTSLEQIFNKFAKDQIAVQNSDKKNKKQNLTILENKDINNDIIVDDNLFNKILY
jgi:ATP-binding cassette subfamily A (ABC1) protein 3